jgi:UPF0271 protein
MRSIDINCDMGESFGTWRLGQDEALMDYVSSVNIACGFHAGDPSVMRRTVNLAAQKNIAIGAHPGYADLQGFGRREIKVSPDEVYDIVAYQIGALTSFTKAAGTHLHHVKPHGALYNAAAKDPSLASAIARAVYDVDKNLVLVGLSSSCLIDEAKKTGLKICNEVFADRSYQEDASLTPRTKSDALISDPQQAANQVLQMVQRGTVTTTSGKEIPVVAETICIHGDGKFALEFAKAIVSILTQNHVLIKRP